MTDQTCAICHYWRSTETVEFANDTPREIGQCRRHAPRIVDAFVGDASDEHLTWQATRFPVTSADDWCGEFEVLGGKAAAFVAAVGRLS